MPALLLNMTNVETGMQMVLSPFYLAYTAYADTGAIEDFYRKSAEMKQMPLSTAVGLSARFPWILPAGWHEFDVTVAGKQQPRRMSFVDGGYYEGSGVVTAENLAQYLLKYAEEHKAELNGQEIFIRIIMITGSYQPVERFFQTQQNVRSLDELTSPLMTLLRAWRARNAAFPVALEQDRRQGPYIAASAQFDNDFFSLPLGWQLANFSRKYLDLFTGKPQDCVRGVDPNADEKTPIAFMNKNNCLVRTIVDDLRVVPVTGTGR